MEKWVALAGLAFVFTVGLVVRDATHQEWEHYQRAYYRLAMLRAGNAAQKEWARSQRVEIKQVLPKGLGTVERCITCHVAIDDPRFRAEAEPLRQHSDLLRSHPPEKYGCVVCHGGEGRAANTLEAHGQGKILSNPLVKGEYLEAACYNCHGSKTLAPEATAAVAVGKQLVNRYMCLGCHQIEGAGGQEGPDLSTVGSRRNWLWLYAHLARPQAVTVGSTMPVFALSREEIRDITVYLMTLRDPSDQLRYAMLQVGEKEEPKSLLQDQTGRKETKEPAGERPGEITYEGRELFEGAGCIVCHSIGRRGGQVGPALTYIGRKPSAKELSKLLRDPEQVVPGGKMPQLHLSDRQIEALTAYLTTLQ